MRYDYDMFSLIPEDIRGPFQGMFNELGLNPMASQQRGLWRDAAGVEALHGADPVIKELFTDAGFGINQYFSGAPEGRYLEMDRPAREALEDRFLDALAERLDDGSLDGANWNGFVLEDFLEYLETATPIDEVEVQALEAAALKASKARGQKKMLAMGVMALGVIVLGFVAVSMMFAPVTIASR